MDSHKLTKNSHRFNVVRYPLLAISALLIAFTQFTQSAFAYSLPVIDNQNDVSTLNADYQVSSIQTMNRREINNEKTITLRTMRGIRDAEVEQYTSNPISGYILNLNSGIVVNSLVFNQGWETIISLRYSDTSNKSLGVRIFTMKTANGQAQITETSNSFIGDASPLGAQCAKWNNKCLSNALSRCPNGKCAFLYWNKPLLVMCLVTSCGIAYWSCCDKVVKPDWDDPD